MCTLRKRSCLRSSQGLHPLQRVKSWKKVVSWDLLIIWLIQRLSNLQSLRRLTTFSLPSTRQKEQIWMQPIQGLARWPSTKTLSISTSASKTRRSCNFSEARQVASQLNWPWTGSVSLWKSRNNAKPPTPEGMKATDSTTLDLRWALRHDFLTKYWPRDKTLPWEVKIAIDCNLSSSKVVIEWSSDYK